MKKPQPIETAPRDGTVILTDSGLARYKPFWNSRESWYSCDPSGEVFRCADEGYFTCSPLFWIPLPNWINN